MGTVLVVKKWRGKLNGTSGAFGTADPLSIRGRDIEQLGDLQEVLGLGTHAKDSAYIEEVGEDEMMDLDSVSIVSYSTNATMDDNPGTGRTIDKHFYQPVGRAIEKFALKIGLRLNIFQPSPAHILRLVLETFTGMSFRSSHLMDPNEIMNELTKWEPTVAPGLHSLVKQSRSRSVYRSYSALAALIRISFSATGYYDFNNFYRSFAFEGIIFQSRTLASSLGDSQIEKEYLLSLLDLGQAALIANSWRYPRDQSEKEMSQYAVSLRRELTDIISLQRNRNVLITSVGKATVVFAKVTNFIYSLDKYSFIGPAARSILDTTYFTIIFIIYCINWFYSNAELDGLRCAIPALHHIFVTVLFDWFSAVADNRIHHVTGDLRNPEWVLYGGLLRSPFYATVLSFPEVHVERRIIALSDLPRRARYKYRIEHPPQIFSFILTWVPRSRRLLSSLDELVKEVQAITPTFTHVIPSMALRPTQRTEWTEKRLRTLLDKASRTHVGWSDLTDRFLTSRDEPHNINVYEDLLMWKRYQERGEKRHCSGQVLLCNFDCDWDLSSTLTRLFPTSKVYDQKAVYLVNARDLKEQDTTWKVSIKSPTRRAPEKIMVEYRTETGEIKYKMFHADQAADDFGTLNCEQAPDSDSDPSTSKGTAEVHNFPVGSECMNILDYRDINRHARRKIEGWLKEGWSVSWKWNGQCGHKLGLRWESEYIITSVHRMSLRKAYRHATQPLPLPGGSFKLEFPTTPDTPWWWLEKYYDWA